MPNSVSAASSVQNKIRLQLAVCDADPWPGLSISGDAFINGERVAVAQLKPERGAFVCESGSLTLDSLDALIVRTLLQLPRSGETFRAGSREFATVLALLRQHSSACKIEESGRVAELEVLTAPPDCGLRIDNCGTGEEPSSPGGPGSISLSIKVLPIFRCSESGEELKLPLHRGSSYWTFQHAIAPVPELPSEPLLRSALLSDAALTFSGNTATEMIFQARQAAKNGSCAVHLDSTLANTKVNPEPLRENTVIRFDENGRLVIAHELISPSGKSIALPSEKQATGQWLEVEGRLCRIPDGSRSKSGTRVLEGDAIADFLRDELPKYKAQRAKIDATVELTQVFESLQPVLKLEESKKSSDAVAASLSFQANRGMGVSPMSLEPTAITADEIFEAARTGRKYVRKGNAFVRVDPEVIAQCQHRFSWAGSPCHEMRGEEIPEVLSWARTVRNDVHTPWNVYVSAAVEGAHVVKDDAAKLRFGLDVDDEEGDTWFTLNPSFEHDGEGLSEDELRKLVREGKKWLRKNRTWVKVDADALKKFELTAEESGLSRWRGRRKQYYYRFRPAQRDRITDIFSLSGTVEHAQRYQAFLTQLKGFRKIESLPLPKDLQLPLRPYQQQGFEWIAFLASYGLNGILADDMGLGKTAQTIAAITRMKDANGQMPSLIVTPTSLADNWRSEIIKFNPRLRATIYRGSPARRDSLRRELETYDIVLGTYATVRNDAMLLREINWRYVILDEAHFIKNSAAATTKAIKTIPAKHRLALTGTPIQNRLSELWSLFDFLMPEFLGRQMRFRENYEEPIGRMQSGRAETKDEIKTGEFALEKLRERIAPFVLRRLKTDVATDLPPKIENDIFCGLSPEQLAMYRGFADSEEAKVAVKELVEKGAERAHTAIFAALMSLRKICNHADLMYLPREGPRLRVPQAMPGYQSRSGKLEALGELLEQCREGGHRSLIFCQLTSMLDILGHFLTDNGLKFLRIDGETPGTQRQGLVDRFNAEPSLDAFLISTRAGGTGLNLTGADTVIFYDHDWNPANDQQAQDRAYRIGQQRAVNVYRLICKGTLEEKILRRQALKKLLAKSIVQHDSAGMKDLTREELLALFSLEDGQS